MGELLYFVPGRPGIGKQHLAEVGLAHVGGGSPVVRSVTRGPGDESGVMFAIKGEGRQVEAQTVQYLPGVQAWEQMGGGDTWIGYYADNPPGPKELARRQQLPGHLVTLSDGKEWLVPVGRYIGGDTPLPSRMKWDGETWNVGEVKGKYKPLWDAATRAWDLILQSVEDTPEGETATVTLADECNDAAMVLALNYRVGPHEISALDLFDSGSAAQVLLAVVDWPALEELEKKNMAQDEPLGNSGNED